MIVFVHLSTYVQPLASLPTHLLTYVPIFDEHKSIEFKIAKTVSEFCRHPPIFLIIKVFCSTSYIDIIPFVGKW